MSEIKGQLLGIVLVVAVFGAVGSILVGAFQSAATNLEKKISETTEPVAPVKTAGGQSVLDSTLNNNELLVY